MKEMTKAFSDGSAILKEWGNDRIAKNLYAVVCVVDCFRE